VKLKLYNILYLLNKDKSDILSKLGETQIEDGVTAFRLMRNIKNIAVELTNFESARQKLVLQYGTKKEGTDKIEILPNTPQMEEYLKQLNKLSQEELEINILLLNPQYLKGFKPLELFQIDWMLQDESE
jgi:hypothetical protein